MFIFVLSSGSVPQKGWGEGEGVQAPSWSLYLSLGRATIMASLQQPEILGAALVSCLSSSLGNQA